jgi:hypothetical protein
MQNQNRRIEKCSLDLSGVVTAALFPDVAECLACFVEKHGFPGAEDPNALLLLERRRVAPRPQCHFIPLDGNVQSVSGAQV